MGGLLENISINNEVHQLEESFDFPT